MLKIVRADTLDNRTLDIELSNGNLILLDITPLLYGNTAYAPLREQKLLPRPQTDGNRIFWQNGPSLMLEEIFALLEGHGDTEKMKEDKK